MLEFNNPERAKDYLEHILRLFGTTAMDHWTDADAFDIRNAIAVITDKDLDWSTEIPDKPCMAWKCVISREDEHVMKAETFLVDMTKFYFFDEGFISFGDAPRISLPKDPIFHEFHYIPDGEEDFWPKEDMHFYKVIEPPYTNMEALIKKTQVKEEPNEDQ